MGRENFRGPTLAARRPRHTLPEGHRRCGVHAGLAHQVDTDAVGLKLLTSGVGQDHAELGAQAQRRAHLVGEPGVFTAQHHQLGQGDSGLSR